MGSSVTMEAQKDADPSKMTTFNVTINEPDYTIKTQMLRENKKVKVKETRVYNWYSNSNKIVQTTGGFDGHVLHGYYKCLYLNGNLKDEGSFNYGLKSGKWTNWFETGKIKEVVYWKNGEKSGKYRIYDPLGNLLVESTFKHDKLNGKLKTFKNGKLVETIKFKDDVQQFAKPKKVKEKQADASPSSEKKEKKKFSLFKKKDKTTSPDKPAEKPKKEKKEKKKKEKAPESKPKEKIS
ncbi:MAG: toxin-antitoxin system YwqK family antitoxin [Bacteroidia bacterium]